MCSSDLQGKLLAIASASGDLSAAFTETTGDLRLRAWFNQTVADLAAAKRAAMQTGRSTADVEAALVDVLKGRERLLPGEAELTDATRAIVSRWDASAAEVVDRRDRIRSAIRGGALVAMEYTSDRPVRAPKTSTFRLVGEVGGRVDLTGNIGATVFDGEIGRAHV